MIVQVVVPEVIELDVDEVAQGEDIEGIIGIQEVQQEGLPALKGDLEVRCIHVVQDIQEVR